MIDIEFIKRAENFYKTDVEEFLEERRKKITVWNNDNRILLRKLQKEYNKTEKGYRACVRRNCIRAQRYRALIKELSKEEKEEVRKFYLNRPKGYEVDHIIPISRGGTHHVSNLQYLTPEENRKKSNHFCAT